MTSNYSHVFRHDIEYFCLFSVLIFTDGGRPQVPYHALCKAQGKTHQHSEASWIASSLQGIQSPRRIRTNGNDRHVILSKH